MPRSLLRRAKSSATLAKVRLGVVHTDTGREVTLTTWDMFTHLSEGIFPLVTITRENEAPDHRRCIFTARDHQIGAIPIATLVGCFAKEDRAEVSMYIMAMHHNQSPIDQDDITVNVAVLEHNLKQLMDSARPSV